jgi:hypothetical protein
VNRAIEEYCDAIAAGEIKVEPPVASGWTSVAASLVSSSKEVGPQDITQKV